MIGLSYHCPPERPQNECSLWMGNTAIRRDQIVNVRTGNAFRLYVKRGIRISLQQLLSFSDSQLREELQSAIWGEVYRRPNVEGLPADAFANNNPTHSHLPASSNDNDQPAWSGQLQEIFENCAITENDDEGPVLYVLVWFVNGHNRWTNSDPRVARLDGDSGWWRSELQFPWRDGISRGATVDLHVVNPHPPQETWQSHAAHVILSQSLDEDHVAVLTTCTVRRGRNDRRLQEAVVTNRFSAVSDIVGLTQHAQLDADSATVQRGTIVFPRDRTVELKSGDSVLIDIDQSDGMTHEEDIDDVQMMQILKKTVGSVNREAARTKTQTSECALGIAEEANPERLSFDFNPQAVVFVPNAQPLPEWARVIEDIYHVWDINAFAWEGEARVAHFLTWYIAPGIGRTHCQHSRRAALRADFWAWREQLRQLWRDEMQIHADFDLALVSPSPDHTEPGIAGHIILTQHSTDEWSSVLISVHDPTLNQGMPFDMAQSIERNGLMRDVLIRIGYLAECTHHAHCQFKVRNAWFAVHDQFYSADGDAIDITVHRNPVPIWAPPPVMPQPVDEGAVLLQVFASKKEVRYEVPHSPDRDVGVASDETEKPCVICLEHVLADPTEDIESIPFTLSLITEQSHAIGQDVVICAWELHHEQTDFSFLPREEFSRQVAADAFRSRHQLIQPCSDIFPVRFQRLSWNISAGSWLIGSFVAPGHDQAIVACVEYRPEGATNRVATLLSQCDSSVIRSCLHIKHGSKVRVNGKSVSGVVHLQHGDTIEYHAADKGDKFVFCRNSSKVQICLEASIDRVTAEFDENKDAIEILPLPDIAHALTQADVWQFCPIPEGVNLHRSTFEALHVQHEIEQVQPDTIELFVDGATADGCSAWAVVAVAVAANGSRLCGCIAGLTEINAEAPNWIGAASHTNIDAELSAMIMATAFAFFGANDIPCVIRPDLALSNKFLALDCVTQHDSTVARVLHSLGQMLPKGIAVSEVRAHRGDPWNELADSIAKWVTLTRKSVGNVPWKQIHELATSPSNLRWEWLRHSADSMKATMPRLYGDAVWQPTPSNKRIANVVNGENYAMQDLQVQFKVATYNALALNDDAGTSWLPGTRTARLDNQFDGQGLGLIGIQEARTAEGMRVSDHYRIFSSGFQQSGRAKHFGCEVWIHKSLPFCTLPCGKKVCLHDCKVTVRRAETRLLVLSIEGPINFVAVAAHAPCVSAERPLDSVRQWWENLAEVIKGQQGDNMLLMIDANAPLADHATEFFGTHQAEEVNPQGLIFQDFLIAHRLFVPSTFEEHLGTAATWRHPRGQHMRRDYVITSEFFRTMVAQSRVITDFDGGFGHVDHSPAMIELRGSMRISPTKHRLRWDYQKMQQADAQKRFQDAIATLPLPSWTISVDDHSAILETNILQLAQQHFGNPRRAKTRPMLQESTINGIGLKRQALDMARSCAFEDPQLVQELKEIEKLVRPMVIQDQKDWYADWLDGINDAHERNDSAQVFKKLQRLGKRKKDINKGPRPLPQLRTEDGECAKTFVDCQQIWQKQFARIEAGVEVNDLQLAQMHLSQQVHDSSSSDGCSTPTEILSIIRKFKNGKVPGPGQLPVDVVKSGGIAMAQILAPLITKASWHMHEPLSWKGGILIPLFKGKGSPCQPMAYRSIFLSDVCAKVHHAGVRSSLASVWQQDNQLIQLGGRKGCSTDVAHHMLHAHISWARHVNRSCAVLFVDLQSAFYSILRSSIFTGAYHDDQICHAMNQLGIKPHEWQEIRRQVEADDATKGIDSHREGILKDMFTGTHFVMHELPGCTATTRGTRPGDPVADILFNMAFRLVVLDARQRISESATISCFGHPSPASDVTKSAGMPASGFAEITFVDDIAYTLHTSAAEDLVPSLQVIASCLHDAASDRGLTINYAAGKTEAVVRVAGPGAKALRHKIWHEMRGKLPIVTEHGVQSLQLVHSYKHLGSYVQDHAITQKDIRYRISQAKKAFGQISRPFYRKKNVNDTTKASVFSALVLSRHAYNAHTWAWVSRHDIETWENGIRAQVTAIAVNKIRPIPPFQFSTAELCALSGINSPQDTLHANRLRYVKRAISKAPAALWSLIHENNDVHSWVARFVDSCQWIDTHLPGGLPVQTVHPGQLLSFIAIDEKWYGRVRSAMKACLQFRRADAEGKLWTLRVEKHVSGLSNLPVLISPKESFSWKCNLCDDSFASKKALAVHARHKHQYRTILKYYVLGDECLACGKKFFHRQRLLAHVNAKNSCREAYIDCFVPAPEQEIDEIEDKERENNQLLKAQGWRPTKAFLPVTIVQGPLLPQAGSEGAAAMKDKWRLRIATSGRAYEGLDGFCDDVSTDTEPAVEILPFVMQTNGGREEGHAGVFQQFGLAAETARLHIRWFIFVHFFSGFRRCNDLQHCIEGQQAVNGGQLLSVSVDLCLARAHSDLTDADTKSFWISRIKAGQVIGLGGGPSCETWSAARFASPGPKPLRSYDKPWGIEGLSSHQWKQVLTGMKLIQFLVDLLVVAAQYGLCGFLEHPQFPLWIMRCRPSSIWATKVIRILARLACFSICSFDQCVYGLDAKKPTTLLLLRLNDFRDITLLRGCGGRCSHRLGHTPLQGINCDGSFNTARAKIYPKAMNAALAAAVTGFLVDRHMHSEHDQLPTELQQLESSEFVNESIVQPDFHNH